MVTLFGGVTPAAISQPDVGAALRLAVACALGTPVADVILASAASNGTGATLSFDPTDTLNMQGSSTSCVQVTRSPQASSSSAAGATAPSTTFVSLLVKACGDVDAAGSATLPLGLNRSLAALVGSNSSSGGGGLSASPAFGSFAALAAAASGVPASSVSAAASSVGLVTAGPPQSSSGAGASGGGTPGLSAAAVAGIVIAVVLVALVLLCVAIALLVVRARKADRQAQREGSGPNTAAGSDPEHLASGVNPMHASRAPRSNSGTETLASPRMGLSGAASARLRAVKGGSARAEARAESGGAPVPHDPPESLSAPALDAPLEQAGEVVQKPNPLHQPATAPRRDLGPAAGGVTDV